MPQTKELCFRLLTQEDLPALVPLYMQYYNAHEGGEWTHETTTRRLLQVVTRMDAFGLVAELAAESGVPAAFAMGYYEQYDDGFAYDLVEIVVRDDLQGRGIGTALMQELERQAKAAGALLVQLQAVNDARHHRFYGRLGYGDASNLTLKTKML